jgi:hypothetical protein
VIDRPSGVGLYLEVFTQDGQTIGTMGQIPAKKGRTFYNKEVTILPLKMDNREPGADILNRVLRQVEQNSGRLSSMTRTRLRKCCRPSGISSLGYVGKPVVTPK